MKNNWYWPKFSYWCIAINLKKKKKVFFFKATLHKICLLRKMYLIQCISSYCIATTWYFI